MDAYSESLIQVLGSWIPTLCVRNIYAKDFDDEIEKLRPV